MSINAAPSQNGQQACPRCGQGFTCGLAANLERCWCFDLPHVIPVESASREGCLCPTCLNNLIDSLTKPQSDEASV